MNVHNGVYTRRHTPSYTYRFLSGTREDPSDTGGVTVAELKRIMITLPNSLLEEVDGMVRSERRNRSEFIREAMRLYINERRRAHVREALIQGYLEMADLNLVLAQEGVEEDERDLEAYEAFISGSE